MPKATELKRGMIIDINGVPHMIRQIEGKSPSTRGGVTIYKVHYVNLINHQKLDEAYKGDDFLREADCMRVEVQYSYVDGDTHYFMNTEDYSQYGLNSENLEGQLEYLVEQQDGIIALIMDGNILGIELPSSVNLAIVDTPPAVSGSSATNRSKTAVLSTGLEVQVPEYLAKGEIIRVNTVTGKFMSRA